MTYQIFDIISTDRDSVDINERIDELKSILGIKTNNNNSGMPDFSKIGEMFNSDKISGMAADIFEKVAPNITGENGPKLTKEEIKKKTSELFNSGAIMDTFSNITSSIKMGKNGMPDINTATMGDTISSLFKAMPSPSQPTTTDEEPKLIKVDDEIVIKSDDEDEKKQHSDEIEIKSDDEDEEVYEEAE